MLLHRFIHLYIFHSHYIAVYNIQSHSFSEIFQEKIPVFFVFSANMNYPATLKKRISSDIFTDPMQLILNKEKAAVNQSNEYQKKQEIKKSTANIIAILKTINIELQNEQDQEISSMLSQQKKIFNKILVQKQTKQKSSFKNAENETMSQL